MVVVECCDGEIEWLCEIVVLCGECGVVDGFDYG